MSMYIYILCKITQCIQGIPFRIYQTSLLDSERLGATIRCQDAGTDTATNLRGPRRDPGLVMPPVSYT